jgi:hypothetical protein
VNVFVVTLDGREDPGAPALTVLAFVAARDAADAGARAAAELERIGWSDIRARRTGELVDEAALPEDFRDAVAGARRYGVHLIIYDET